MNDLLTRIAEDLPRRADWPANGNVTVELASSILRADELDRPKIEAIDALCRKVDVLRIVRVAYDDTWKMATAREPLPPREWPVLIAAFLRAAERLCAIELDGRGRALKLINTAFNAVALYREHAESPEAGYAASLQSWAESLLEETLS